MGNCGIGKCTGLSCEPADKGTPIPRIKTNGRSCTDFPFLILFIGSWIAIWVIFTNALQKKANPDALIRGVNWDDKICGVDDADNPFAAWPGLPGDPKLNDADPHLILSIKICVKDCSQTTNSSNVLTPYTSKKFLYYCIPSHLPDGFDNTFNSESQQASRAFGDLKTSWKLILISGAIAIGLSFIFALFCKKVAGVLVWLTLIGLLAGGALMSYTLLQKSTLISNDAVTPNDSERAKWLRLMGIIASVVTFIFFCIIVFLRKRINIAIQVVKESSKVITGVPSLVFFPIIPLAVALGYFVFWVFVAIYVFSVQVVKADQAIPAALQVYTGPTLKDREFDKSMQRSLIYHFFHLLWNMQFLIYFAYLVVAGVVADWYFTPFNINGTKTYGKGEGQLRPGLVRRSMGRTLCHHIGTIALGSLIIAIIQFARAVVAYLQKQSKNQNNRIQKAIFCMVQCCLKCVECCMDKVSKNAFIWVAVYGDAFCASAAGSFELVWRNLMRVAAINLVGNFIIILGKILVSFLTAGIAAIVLIQTSVYADSISSPILPIFVIFCLAFIISSLFMIIFETTIDSVFLCFLIDEENNKNGVMLASKDLQNIINRFSEESKKVASDIQSSRNPLAQDSFRPNGAGIGT